MRLRPSVRSVIAAAGLTVFGTLAIAVAPTPASAASISPLPSLSTPLPYCVTASDSPGRSATLCVYTVTITPIGGGLFGDTMTATGSIKVCTAAGKCTTSPITLASTGAGLNLADLVPTIVPGPAATVPVTRVCVGTLCTPGTVTVPSYVITLFPSPGAAVVVCVDGLCKSSPLASVNVTDETGNILANLTAE